MSGKEGYPMQAPQPVAAPPYPQGAPPQQFAPQGAPPQGGYPVQGAPGQVPYNPQMAMAAGQNYANQLFALCAQGQHERVTKYGMFGIIMAVMCFPCGLICLFTDTEERCGRCGILLGKS
ncbi:hypothetical protein CVT24_009315 [Panaeolus cyanescens]|uniref:Brain protein I3 n=1 Tax=Panaeolus cyanescens TaxID=181874 RepID=A0A409Y8A7_9AGAR|nr:hypothetical protein CVT24_009315 [Panaeolus cyanescens]